MRFVSNFSCEIIFMCSVNFLHWSRDLLVQGDHCFLHFPRSDSEHEGSDWLVRIN